MLNKRPSPCKNCVKESPYSCTRKSCAEWRQWFFEQWERTRNLFRPPLQNSSEEEPSDTPNV